MATKSIIDIDVNDEKFKKFFELFEQYDSKVKDMPEHWEKLNEATSGGAAAIGAAVSILLEPLNRSADAALEISRNLSKASKAQEQFRKATHESVNGLKKMGKQARDVAHTIFGIGKFVLKAGAVGTGLFAGGVFGLDRLAQSAVGNQRTALGMGLTTGQLRAFKTDFGRYLDPSILSSVSQQQSDWTGRVWLARASGLSIPQVMGTNAANLSTQIAIKAHEWWKSTPESARTTQNLQATGFLQAGLSLDDIRRLGNTPLAQLQQGREQFIRNATDLNISRENTNALYAFSRNLTLAGQRLETDFSRKLAILGPHLGDFIKSLEKDAEKLLGEILTPANLKKLASGIDGLTNYLGKVDFRAIASDIGQFAHAVGSAASYIAKLFPGAGVGGKQPSLHDIATSPAFTENPKKTAIGQWAAKHYLADMAGKGIAKPGSPVDKFYHWLANIYGVKDSAMLSNTQHAYINKAHAAVLFGKLEAAQGLPKGLLYGLAANESSFDAAARSIKGAQGLFQLMPGVSRNLGIENPMDWRQNTLGAVTLFGQLQKRYGGDLAKELAAWNWNPSALDRDIKKHGSDWASYVPDETKVFMSRVLRTMQRQSNRPVNIAISNRSGANVAVSTNAAGL